MKLGDKIRQYSNEEIDIGHDDCRCIHSAECIRGLPAVLWILPSGSSADEIAKVIARCPSGALRFEWRDGGPPEAPAEPASIVPTPAGPLYVRGVVQLRSADGTALIEDMRMALCRCGQSHNNKPFCDNSHLGAGFTDPGSRF